MKIILRVDGDDGKEAGLGHVVRSLAVARLLREYRAEISVQFVMRDFPDGIAKVREAGYEPIRIPTRPSKNDFQACFSNLKPDLIVIDTLGSSDEVMDAARAHARHLITLDDLQSSAGKAEAVINGILWATRWLPAKVGKAQVFQGVEYLCLRDQFRSANGQPREIAETAKKILICTGGADLRGMTAEVIDRLLRDFSGEITVTAVVGAANTDIVSIRSTVGNFPPEQCRIIENTSDISSLMLDHDLAVITGGTVLFEAAACGLPAIVLTCYEHQDPAAEWFAEKGAVHHAGSFTENIGGLSNIVQNLMNDRETRQRMSSVGRQLVDGRGLERVVWIILDHLDRPDAFYALSERSKSVGNALTRSCKRERPSRLSSPCLGSVSEPASESEAMKAAKQVSHSPNERKVDGRRTGRFWWLPERHEKAFTSRQMKEAEEQAGLVIETPDGYACIVPSPFESEFFSLSMARVTCVCTSQGGEPCSLVKTIRNKAAAKGWEHLSIRIPSDDHELIGACHRLGFVQADLHVTLGLENTCRPSARSAANRGVRIDTLTVDDIRECKALARHAFPLSRFYSDPKMDRLSADRLHEKWVENNISGRAGLNLIARSGGNPVGFVNCLLVEGMEPFEVPPRMKIDLISINERYQGLGIGKRLVTEAVSRTRESYPAVSVATQAYNYRALGLYESLGFSIRLMETTLHSDLCNTKSL